MQVLSAILNLDEGLQLYSNLLVDSSAVPKLTRIVNANDALLDALLRGESCRSTDRCENFLVQL
jgi:hypothetical protein